LTPKLQGCLTYPLTGVGCVDRVYTDLAVFDIGPDRVRMRETFGVSADELEQRLHLKFSPRLNT